MAVSPEESTSSDGTATASQPGPQPAAHPTHVQIMDNVDLDPEKRLDIKFRNLSYVVQVSAPNPDKKGPFKRTIKKDKDILRDVSGIFRAGRLTAVMGASGAGKTSLLNLLAGEAKAGELTGTVTVNGQEVYGKEMSKISGFVFQGAIIDQIFSWF